MATVTKPIALNESFNTTELTPRNIADVLAQELSRITGRNASQVEYDNTESGLDADNVQDALDEINGKIPTVPSVDIQTAVDEFETYNGGLLSECKVTLTPVQNKHGYPNPWVGGAGKNKLPLVLADIKSANTSGTWSGNVYTISGGTFEVLVDDADNVLGIKVNGTFNANTYFDFMSSFDSTYFAGMVFNGVPSGSSGMVRISKSDRVALQNIYGYDTPIVDNGSNLKIAIRVAANITVYNELFYPMIRLSTESDPTFEPYSNICPITGHTQVDVDVSDGQATQEQVTVNLGGTYYSGTLDVVSGVFTPDTAELIYDGSVDEGWSIQNVVDGNTLFISTVNIPLPNYSTKYQSSVSNPNTAGSSTSTAGTYIYNSTLRVRVTPDVASTVSDFTTWLSNNPLQVVYELATPTPIQLSPTMVKALVGENHLSAPLDGQEITESEYKQMFTFDDVIAYIQSLS